MRMTTRCLAALLCAGLCTSFVHAQRYVYPPPWPPQPRLPVPDACGPGFYRYCPDGSYIGPNYYLRPPFEPFNGMHPQMQQPGGKGAPRPGPPMTGYVPGQYMGMSPVPGGPMLPPIPRSGPAAPYGPNGQPSQKSMVAFPTHPYARSPRDYFMWSEAQEDIHTRERRPAFVP